MRDMAKLFEKTAYSNGSHQKDVAISKKSSRTADTTPQALEVAIVGLGDWGQQAILSSLNNTTHFKFIKQFHLVAGDNHVAIDAQFGHQANMQVYHAVEYENLLRDPALSAVIVSTPCHTHYETAKAALLAKKHVFVEKTFTLREDHAAELLTLAHQKGLKLMVGYEYMYDDAFSTIGRLIKNRTLGEIHTLELYLFNRRKTGISSDLKYGTSIVDHHCTHLLSILQVLLGTRKIEALEILEAESEYLRLRLRYASLEVILAVAIDLPNHQNYRTAIIHGTEKTVESDFNGLYPSFTVKRSRDGFLIQNTEKGYPVLLKNDFSVPPVQREFEHFFKCIARNRPTISGGKTALHLVKMTAQIEHAYQEKKHETKQTLRDEDRQVRQEISQALDRLWLENAHDSESAALIKHFSQDQAHAATAAETTLAVAHYLSGKPYATVREITTHLGLSHAALSVAYKLIQNVEGIQKIFRRSVNSDYFDVVDRFFDQNHYEVTFFVGSSCTYKCNFCRMNMAAQEKKEGDLLQYREVVQVFEGLKEIRDADRPVSVKISGGLEPLSDPKRVAFILAQAKNLGLPVRIDSSGMRINTADKRALVLSCDDLRINLNALNESYFQEICHACTAKHSKISFNDIVNILKTLVTERSDLASKPPIGINYVVLKENVQEMWLMAAFCRDIGLDYVHFNTHDCSNFDDQIYISIEQQINKIKMMHARGDFASLKVHFGGALLKQNIFTQQPTGDFDPRSMAQRKVFVNPAGEVTPVHEGTYPFQTREGKTGQNPYVLGKLSEQTNFQDLLKNNAPLPPIGFRYLSPSELILGLECIRQVKDKADGFAATHSPYRQSAANKPLAP